MTTTEPRIAYLTGVYPLASHTFIQREIAALRDLGAEIVTASIRRPPAPEIIGPEEEAAQAETFYVLQAARSLRPLTDHARLIAAAPGRWARTLGLALRTARPGLKGLIWQVFYFVEAGILARHLRATGATHLHNHFADSSASVAMLAAALADLPYSFTIHGPTEFFAPDTWRLDEKVARAHRVICISHFARSQMMLFADPAHWDRFRIVHCGVVPDRYAAPDPPTGDPATFLFVGRLDPVKGLRVLLDAFATARARMPGIRLRIIGDGADRAFVEAEAARVGGIEVMGYRSQSEVAATLAASDALVLPSFAEGVPVALMEAMAAGRPVIATRVGGVAELVDHGTSGLLVAPGDAEGLADALCDLAADPDLRRRMGEAGAARVRAEFDIATEAARLKRVFDGTDGGALRPDP